MRSRLVMTKDQLIRPRCKLEKEIELAAEWNIIIGAEGGAIGSRWGRGALPAG